MSWYKIVEEKPEHRRCDPPLSMVTILHAKAGPGSIWECDICHKRHVFIGSDLGAALWREATMVDFLEIERARED